MIEAQDEEDLENAGCVQCSVMVQVCSYFVPILLTSACILLM